MRSKLQRRIISLLAVVAFGATGAADAYGLHSCPHHDALPGAAARAGTPGFDAHAGVAGAAHADRGADAGTSHAGNSAQAGSPHQHAQDTSGVPAEHDGHGPCTCVGTCSANPPAPPLENPHVTFVAPLGTTASMVPAQTQPHASTTPYLLPWANAPPVSASL